MDKNIHILSLEYGYEHQTGFKYKELKSYLEDDHKISFTFELEFAFRIWFAQAFFNPNIEDDINHRKLKPSSGFRNLYTQQQLPFSNSTNDINNSISFITGDSIIQFLDFIELQEARASANTAKKFSFISIGIAVIAVLLPLFLTQSVEVVNPQPPSANSAETLTLKSDSIEVKTQKTDTLKTQ